MMHWLGLDGAPPLVRFILLHAAIGAVAGAACAGAIIATDTLGVGRLIASTSNPWIPGLLLLDGFMVTFGSLSAGAALMRADRPGRG